MRNLLCIAFLCCNFFAGAQEKKWHTSVDAETDINKFSVFDFGFRLGEGVEFNRKYFIGGSAGITKFKEHIGVYFPMAVRGMIAFSNRSSYVPLAIIEPGYGYYHQQVEVNNVLYTMRGGFYLYVGAGVAHAISGTALTLSAGFSNYAFSGLPYQLIHHRLTVRVGVVL